MAFEFKPEEEEKDKEVQPSTAAPLTAASAGSPVGGPMTQAAAPAAPQGSGRFINLQKYIQANAPKSQEQSLGGQIAQKFGQQVGQVGQKIGQAQQQFQTGIAPEQQRLAGAKSNIQQTLAAATSPSNLTPEQIQQFQAFSQGQARGPQEMQGLQQLRSDVAQVGRTAGLAQSEPGRFQLLRNYFGTPTYSTGQQRLDQLLLQSQPSGLQNLRSQAQGANQALGSAQQQTSQTLGELARQRAEAQTAAQTGVTDAQTAEQGAITSEAERLTGQRNQLATKLSQLLNGRGGTGFRQDELSLLGLNPADIEGINISGVDLSSFTPNSPQAITAGQVATPEQRARLEALSQLAGTDQTFLGEQSDINPIFSQGQLGTLRERGQASQELMRSQPMNDPSLAGTGWDNFSVRQAEQMIESLRTDPYISDRSREMAMNQLQASVNRFNNSQVGQPTLQGLLMGNRPGFKEIPTTQIGPKPRV